MKASRETASCDCRPIPQLETPVNGDGGVEPRRTVPRLAGFLRALFVSPMTYRILLAVVLVIQAWLVGEITTLAEAMRAFWELWALAHAEELST